MFLKRKQIANLILFLFLTTLFFFRMQSPQTEKTTTFSGNQMTMNYKVIIGKKLTQQEKQQIAQKIHHIFKEINDIYNSWNPKSELSKINKLPANTKIKLSKKLYTFLLKTDEMVTLTQGKFDPTVLPLQKLYRKHFEKGSFPNKETVEVLLPSIGWKHIYLEKGYFWKDHHLTQIDLGGIVKGFAVDQIVESLNTLGYLNVFVEWGGEIRASGKHPNNRMWQVAIFDEKKINTTQQIALANQAIATSGNYHQFWKIDDKVFTHIIDPETGFPLEVSPHSISSISVLASDCLTADAIATSGMIFHSLDEAKKWAFEIKNKNKNIKILIK